MLKNKLGLEEGLEVVEKFFQNMDARIIFEKYRKFALGILSEGPGGIFDEYEYETAQSLIDLAVEGGFFEKITPKESCGEGCRCREYFSEKDFTEGQVECYRKSDLLVEEERKFRNLP
jgi:hypothetical protein